MLQLLYHEHYPDEGILAMSPLVTGIGCVPHAIVLRALHYLHPADDPQKAPKYAVQELIINEDQTLLYEEGNYFEVCDYKDRQEALAMAWERFEERARSTLGLPRRHPETGSPKGQNRDG